MKQIKFSHEYFKLNARSKQAFLLEVINVNLEDLSGTFKNYDTEFFTQEQKLDHYKLPKKGKFMLLIFRDDRFHVFTTLRRHLPQKEKYYRDSIGHIFDIVIEEKE